MSTADTDTRHYSLHDGIDLASLADILNQSNAFNFNQRGDDEPNREPIPIYPFVFKCDEESRTCWRAEIYSKQLFEDNLVSWSFRDDHVDSSTVQNEGTVDCGVRLCIDIPCTTKGDGSPSHPFASLNREARFVPHHVRCFMDETRYTCTLLKQPGFWRYGRRAVPSEPHLEVVGILSAVTPTGMKLSRGVETSLPVERIVIEVFPRPETGGKADTTMPDENTEDDWLDENDWLDEQ